MTAAPAFLLVGVIFVIAFIAIAFITGLGLSWLGKHYSSIKIRRPFFSVYLIAGLAFVVQLFFAVPQIAVSSVVSTSINVVPPYYFCFFIVGIIIFSIRMEGKYSGKKTALYASCLSLVCILFFYLIETAFLLYIQTAKII
ncbi:hypothetical protein ACLPHM_03090 [Paenalcaligenes sp. Me131]|uniref:hypothetical protein n=1 Tax=Paenalcaligenes sp. Me131 TaxID=3392636 RepID=UPI003D2D579B